MKHIKDIAERVLVTFLEGFGAAWFLTSFAMTKVALLGALGAGLSAVYNVAKKYVQATA